MINDEDCTRARDISCLTISNDVLLQLQDAFFKYMYVAFNFYKLS